MSNPVLYDAVTLRHFASVSRLDLLPSCHGFRQEPRWVTGVKGEITRARLAGYPECQSILDETWLGDPVEPLEKDLSSIARIQIALGNSGAFAEDEADISAHRGEAESIHLAQQNRYHFVTDDNDAHQIASLRLGPERVHDSIDLLRLAVANGDLTKSQAVDVHVRIRSQDRHFRRPYERILSPRDFDM